MADIKIHIICVCFVTLNCNHKLIKQYNLKVINACLRTDSKLCFKIKIHPKDDFEIIETQDQVKNLQVKNELCYIKHRISFTNLYLILQI